MENQYDKILMVSGHSSFFGRRIGRKELVELVSPYPASQWLELCAKIEGFLSVKRVDVPNPQTYLSQVLFPPSTLSRVNRHSDEGVMLFSLGQLNFLRKFVIAYARNDGNQAEVPIPKTTISKVFLAAQDFHNDYDEAVGKHGDLESFCQFIIRNGYMNGNLDAAGLFTRAHQMYVLHEKRVQFNDKQKFSDLFNQKVGLTIEQAMALSFALASPFFQDKKVLIEQTTIIDPKTYFENLVIDPQLVGSIIENLVIDFADAKTEFLKEMSAHENGCEPTGYNLDLFRKTPLIRLSDGKLVCANLSCLLEKTTQNIIWLPKSRAVDLDVSQMDKLVIELTSYRGRLFEEHIKNLCDEMAHKNPKIVSHYIPPQATSNHEEVGDSLLIQGEKLLILEAKSRQFKESFKYTGDWSKDKQFITELIKKAADQIETAARKIRNGEIEKLPIKPEDIKRIYPIVVTYEPIPMHGKMQRYVRQQLTELGCLSDPIFAPMEILYVDDIESVMNSAETYTLADVLEHKDSGDIHASETNFNNFYSHFVTSRNVLSNGWGAEKFNEFWRQVFAPNLKFKSKPPTGLIL